MLKKYFSISLLIFSTFFLLYVIYKSEFVWWGKKQDYYLIYYIFSISLILLSLVTFILNDKFKEYIFIFLLTIFIFSYSFEVYSTSENNIFFQHKRDLKKKSNIYKTKTGKKFDTRSRLKIYNDLKKTNTDVAITVHPSSYLNQINLDFFPLSSSSNVKTILCNEIGYYNIYKSDRYGFNNPDSEWDEQQIEYFLIGDSYVHGSCVNRPDDIASILRSLSKKTALNLGYEGSGPLIEYGILKEYIRPNIKNILWFYAEINDVEDLRNELENKILINYLKNDNFSQNLKNKQNLINQKSRATLSQYLENKKFKIYKFLKLTNLRVYLHDYIFPEKFNPNFRELKPQEPLLSKEFRNLLKKVDYLSKQNNSKLYFVYIPTYYRYNENFIKKNQKFIKSWDNNYNTIKSILTDLNIPIIDLHQKVLKKEKNPLELFPFALFDNVHMNEAGYKKFAEIIYTSISEE